MRKQHLDFLPFVAADLVGFRLPVGSREVLSVLVFFPADRSTNRVGAALFFRGTSLAIGFEGPILSRAADVLAPVAVRVTPTELFQREAFRANVLVVGGVIFKLKPCPCAIVSFNSVGSCRLWYLKERELWTDESSKLALDGVSRRFISRAL